MSKKSATSTKPFKTRPDHPVWALVDPEGNTHPAWLYESKEDLMRDAPGQLYGDVSTWERAKAEGYRAKKFYLTVEKPQPKTKAKAKTVTKKDAPPTDTDMLDYLQKHAHEIRRASVRTWFFKGKKNGNIGGITLRKLVERAIQARCK